MTAVHPSFRSLVPVAGIAATALLAGMGCAHGPAAHGPAAHGTADSHRAAADEATAESARIQPGETDGAPSEELARHARAESFAGALDEAFARYEAEVRAALRLDYGSEVEAQAVAQTLDAHRFDMHLDAALRAQGLTVADLGAFAKAHPDFFHAQQRRHWGRLEQLRGALTAMVDRVGATDEAPAQVSMLAR
jgi:hypothetical protein